MKAFLASAAAVALVAVAMPAAAEVNASIAYTNVDANLAKFDTVTGRVGWRATWLGVEAEASTGVDDETVNAGVPVELKLQHQIAAYGMAFLPVNENLDLFARVGYGETKIKASGGGVSSSGSDHSVNYGVGAQWLFDGRNGVRADYTRYDFDNGGDDADTWSVGYVRKF